MPKGKKYVGPIDDQTIGRRLREIRERRGMTQAELAKKMHIDQSLISDYERGILRLHGALIAGLARTLRVSTDDIIGYQKSKSDGLAKGRRFLRRLQKIERLSRRDKEVLLRNMDAFLKGAGVD